MMIHRPEHRLLLTASRQALSPDLAEQLREILSTGVRWDYLQTAANHHGVSSLVYHHLHAASFATLVPSDVRRSLFQAYVRTAFRTVQQLKTLETVLAAFAEAGIATIVLKGPYLVQSIYDDPAFRPFCDLDLLIRERDLGRAAACLARSCFRTPSTLLSEQLARKFHFNLPFVKADPFPQAVELHWQLTDRYKPYRIDIKGVWERASATTFSTAQALSLSWEDLLTHLAVHLDTHGYLNQALSRWETLDFVFHPWSENRVIWFTDLYEVVQKKRDTLDWEGFIRRAKEAGAGRSLSGTFILLNKLYGPVVDPPVIRALGPPHPQVIKTVLLRRLSASPPDLMQVTASQGRGLTSQLLLTRRTVQFRLIRLLDLWDYIFPPLETINAMSKARGPALAYQYVRHVMRATASCLMHGSELLFFLLRQPIRSYLSAWRQP